MRKIILLLPFLVMLFGFKTFAYNSTNLTNFKNDFYSHYNHVLSDAQANQILTKWESTGMRYCVTYCNNDSTYNLRCGYSSNVAGSGTDYRINAPYYSSGENGGGYITSGTNMTWTGWSYRTTGYENFSVYGWKWDAETYLAEPIDWASPQYNPNMPIPEISTNYGEISVNSSSPEIPFDINFVNPNNDYYIEIYCDYWIPDNMSISINRGLQNNDGYVYKAMSRDLVSGYLIDPEQMLRIQGINNLKLQLQTNWENALTQVPVSALEYANPNNLPSGMFNQYKNTYENYCRNILGFYGSQFTIMMRYFTIVNDTQYVVGAWRTWTTYSPNEFTERLPDYYVPYVPASGQENITNNIDPENIEILQGTGSNTGAISDPNYYITVNQNTPNYPDYPTIASYNKDNLLLDTMNHINSLSTFFGEFGDFLTTSFAFFPAWIWAIIGAGFGISIVVMFLKIL